MRPDQDQKAARFRALHQGGAFIIPNPWDAGSAKVLAALGFQALASTSSGLAFTLGRPDGNVTLDEVIAHTRLLVQATALPISVDLENGYGPDPEHAARAITRAAEAGAVGGSIEDYDPDGSIYGFDHAVQRVAAACDTIDTLRVVDGDFLFLSHLFARRRHDTIARAFYGKKARRFVLFQLGSGRRFSAASLARLVGAEKIVIDGVHDVGSQHVRTDPDATDDNNLLEVFGELAPDEPTIEDVPDDEDEE